MSRLLLLTTASQKTHLIKRRWLATMSTIPTFIDIGVNLTDDMYSGRYHGRKAHAADLDIVMERGQKAGVISQMVTVGHIKEIQPVLALTKKYEGLYSTAGVHPTRASKVGKDYLDELRSVLNKHAVSTSNSSGKIIAIGECGLDYDRLHFSSKEEQLCQFELQLQLAKEYQLPLFLHCRAAHTDFITIIRRQMSQKIEGSDERKRTGVVHCFTGTLDEMKELIEMGFLIGMTGCSVRSQEGIAVAKEIPLDRLMLETDAPWCDLRATHASAPFWSAFSKARPGLAQLYQPASAKKEKWDKEKTVKGRNEPCAIGCVAAVIAQVKGITIEEVASAALNNTQFLLGI